MFESWLKNMSAHFGEIESGYRRGERHGRETGLAEGRLEVARKLLHLGVDLEVISEATSYSIDELSQLSQQHSGA